MSESLFIRKDKDILLPPKSQITQPKFNNKTYHVLALESIQLLLQARLFLANAVVLIFVYYMEFALTRALIVSISKKNTTYYNNRSYLYMLGLPVS